jgi:hypothetical protein
MAGLGSLAPGVVSLIDVHEKAMPATTRQAVNAPGGTHPESDHPGFAHKMTADGENFMAARSVKAALHASRDAAR